MMQYLRKLLFFTLFIVTLLPARAVDITIETDDPSSVQFLYGCDVLTESGTYSVQYGDEVRTLNLNIVCTKSTHSTQEVTIELGQSYLFQCDVLTPEEAGDSEHTYTLENAAGCDSIITLTLHTLEPVPSSIGDMVSGSSPLRIVPSVVTVGTPVCLYDLSNDEESTMHIYATDGCCVMTSVRKPSSESADGKATIATDNLPAGIYTIQVVSGSTKTALRFIVMQ